MPLYEYECLKCGRRTEKIENVSGPHLKKCPHCGGTVEPVISPPAIQFKGSGWYVTDYSGRSEKSANEKPTTETKDTTKESNTKESTSKEILPKDKKAATKK